MQPNRAISVSLPGDVLDRLQSKVASGEYASESDVIQEGLRILEKRSAATETWLRTEVVQSFDDYKADPSIGISGAEVSDGLDARLDAYQGRPRRG